MKKALKITAIVLLVLVAAAAALAVWQWRNISALISGVRYSSEELAEINVTNAEATLADMNSQVSVELRDMTEEEKQKIASGELSQTSVMAQIFAEAMPEAAPEAADAPSAQTDAQTPTDEAAPPAQQADASAKPAKKPEAAAKPSAPKQTEPPAKTADQLVAEAVARLSSLQSSYMGKIDSALVNAKAYYDQQKTVSSKAVARSNALSKLVGDVNSLQSQCDAEVEGVLSKLSAELDARGADKSIISTMRDAYENEKAAQKAAYVKKYADKL